MAYIEFQLSDSRLVGLVQVRAMQAQRASTVIVDGQAFAVDQLSLLDGELRHDEAVTQFVFWQEGQTAPIADTVPATRVQVRQDVHVRLARLGTDRNGQPTIERIGPFTVRAVVELYATMTDQPFLDVGLTRLEVLRPTQDFSIDPAFATALDALVRPLFPSTSLPILVSGSAGRLQFANVGVAASRTGTRVAFRLQLGYENEFSVGPWRIFYRGDFEDFVPIGRNWALFTSKALAETNVADAFYAALAERADEFRLNGGVNVRWAPRGNTPRFDVDFFGDALTPCPIDITYHVTAGLDLDMASINTLQVQGRVDWSGDTLEEFGCELIGAFTLGLVTTGIGSALVGPFPASLAGSFAIGAGLVGAIYFVSTYSPNLSGAKCRKTGDHQITCEVPLGFSFGNPKSTNGISLNVLAVATASDGPVFYGALVGPGFIIQSAQLDVSAGGFAWRPPDLSCGNFGPSTLSDLQAHIEERAVAVATVSLQNSGGGTLEIAGVERVSDDPLGMFPAESIELHDYGGSALVFVRATSNAAYALHPYPCVLLVTSNGGAKFAILDLVPVLDQTAIDGVISAARELLKTCVETSDDWWQHHHQHPAEWLVDPPPGEAIVDRLRDIKVTGVLPGDTVRLQAPDGGGLVSATADAQGTIRLSALASGQARSETPVLVRERSPLAPVGASPHADVHATRSPLSPAPAPGVTSSTWQTPIVSPAPSPGITNSTRQTQIVSPARARRVAISTRQTEIVQRATISLEEPCRQAAIGSGDGAPALYALGERSLAIFALGDPGRPRLLRRIDLRSAGGFVFDRDQVLVWGPCGLFVVPSRSGRPRLIDATPIAGAATIRNRVLVAGDRGLLVLRRDEPCGCVKLQPVDGGPSLVTALGSTSRLLVAGTTDGVSTLELAADDTLVARGTLAFGAVAIIAEAPLNHPRSAVFVGEPSGAGAIVDFADPSRPAVVARYDQRPWFLEVVRRDRLVLQLDAERQTVIVATAERSVVA
jgi:hypothetical protein